MEKRIITTEVMEEDQRIEGLKLVVVQWAFA